MEELSSLAGGILLHFDFNPLYYDVTTTPGLTFHHSGVSCNPLTRTFSIDMGTSSNKLAATESSANAIEQSE